MSIAKKLESRRDDMEKIVNYVRDLTSLSETGRETVSASIILAGTGLMTELYDGLRNPAISNEDSIELFNILQRYMRIDPTNSMRLFVEAIGRIIDGAEGDKDIESIFIPIMDTATEVANSEEYENYMIANENFYNDDCKEAKFAREAIEAMNAKLKEWSKN
jgi:hypothetical protein